MNYFFNIVMYGVALIFLIISGAVYLRCFIMLICNGDISAINLTSMIVSIILIVILGNYLKLL